MRSIKSVVYACLIGVGILASAVSWAQDPVISDATQECIDCHVSIHPGIVADWKRSRHASVTPAQALKKTKLQRRISVDKPPKGKENTVVGCAECHTMNAEAHKETVDHNGYNMHITVTPKDCASCHPEEAQQFEKNVMAWARTNLANNTLYQSIVKSVIGVQSYHDGKTTVAKPDAQTEADSCFHCHGTNLEMKGKKTRETDVGEMEFAVLSGWPNQGVGRYNPDGSKGACSACHSRHQFSIEMARKPYTCSQCHKGPDVPAYKAYDVSKHGNIHAAMKKEWNFKEVPWKIGKDFAAPTCAACHVSLVTDQDGNVIAKRTHQMTDRLAWRILGLIYSHPHPKSPDTTIIKNKNSLPLPTTLDNKPASDFLISKEEMEKRKATIQKVCLGCHSRNWVSGHWARFENTIKTTNDMTLAATKVQLEAWKTGAADNKTSLFDEALEKEWIEQWLFFANSTRFASAMMGADYGVFANGRWYMSKNLRSMIDRMHFLRSQKKK